MSNERLSPERAARLLRAKAAELETFVEVTLPGDSDTRANDATTAYLAANAATTAYLAADIALIAGLLADHIEDLISDGDLSPDIDDANVRDMRDG